MKKRDQNQELRDRYRYPGFYPSRTVTVAVWDEGARIIRLTRRSKKRNAADVGLFGMVGTIAAADGYETCRVVTHAFSWSWKSAE
jgi:hypothetical protein